MNNPHENPIEQLQCVRLFEEGKQKGLKFHAKSLIATATDDYYKELFPFTHYQPPTAKGAEAPISLALAHMGNGARVLIRKNYVHGPQPYANIHLLVGFSPKFLLRDAIMLWNLHFWNDNSYQKAAAQGTNLPSFALHTLKKYVDEPFSLPNDADLEAALTRLPFLIQFFLLQQFYLEHRDAGEKRKVPRILINLSADQVAYLIYVLSRLLPSQLLNTTTFNTYEHDLGRQSYTICGTYLADLASHKEDDFILASTAESEPQGLYQDSISSVVFSQITNYANHASQWFKPDMSLDSEGTTFLLRTERFLQLSIEAFLTEYEQRFGRLSTVPAHTATFGPGPDLELAHTPPPVLSSGSGDLPLPQSDLSLEENVDATTVLPREETKRKAEQMLAAKQKEDAIANASVAHFPDETKGVHSSCAKSPKPLPKVTIMEEFAKGPENIRRLLDEESSRQDVIDLMLLEPEWFWKQLWDQLKAWFEVASKTSKGCKVLSKFLQSVTVISIHATDSRNSIVFRNSIRLLAYLPVLLPSDEDNWRYLLRNLRCHEQNYEALLQENWFSREFLLNIAGQVLSDNIPEDEDIIIPLLKVTPAELGKLLIAPVLSTQTLTNAGTHELRFQVSRWSYVAIKRFVQDSNAILPPEVIRHFNQHHELVSALFAAIGRLETPNRWMVLAYFFNLLIRSNYKYKDDLITYLFSNNLPVEEAKEIVIYLPEPEQEALFQHYEKLCIEYFPFSKTFRVLTCRCLPASPLTWQQISNLDLMLSKQSKEQIDALIPDLAELLDACVDGPMSLGMLFPSLLRLGTNLSALLTQMASLARRAIEIQLVIGASKKQAQPDEDARRSIVHFSSYIEFALCFEHVYDRKNIPRGLRKELLDTLLNEASEHVFVLISSEAKYWQSVGLYEAWEYIVQQYRTPPPPPPPPDLRQLTKEEEQVIAQIDKLIENGGAGELGLFWIEHSIMLYAIGKEIVNSPTTTSSVNNRWNYLRVAYDFYAACKKAEYSKRNPHALQKAEQEIVDIVRYNEAFLQLIPREDKRVKRAQKRLSVRTNTLI